MPLHTVASAGVAGDNKTTTIRWCRARRRQPLKRRDGLQRAEVALPFPVVRAVTLRAENPRAWRM